MWTKDRDGFASGIVGKSRSILETLGLPRSLVLVLALLGEYGLAGRVLLVAFISVAFGTASRFLDTVVLTLRSISGYPIG